MSVELHQAGGAREGVQYNATVGMAAGALLYLRRLGCHLVNKLLEIERDCFESRFSRCSALNTTTADAHKGYKNGSGVLCFVAQPGALLSAAFLSVPTIPKRMEIYIAAPALTQEVPALTTHTHTP